MPAGTLSSSPNLSFPGNFTWGAATSAYQIEGAWDADGKGPSIWDTFTRRCGRVQGGDSGRVAADHYHRWQEDVELMAALGLTAYRFSTAWTRILPAGAGPVNGPGLDFYDRLVDALLAKGITPYPTLFHYDLPQPLQDRGGWPKRDTAYRFSEYASVVARRLGDRVGHWITHNEPWITAVFGYLSGLHAPGRRSPTAALAALHHLLLSHGLALQALRAEVRSPADIGIALNLSPIYPASGSQGDARAASLVDCLMNRITLDPLLRGSYPAELSSTRAWRWLERGGISAGDLQIISLPLDFVGVNYYSRGIVRRLPLLQAMPVRARDSAYNLMGEIYPQGLYDLLLRLHRDYAHPRLLVSENGAPFPDTVTPDGQVHDAQRTAYLQSHLEQVRRALQHGAPVGGYFVWSLLDNFEWAYGYSRRFGLVYIDYPTQQRILKDSGRWYAQMIAQNRKY